MNVHLVALEWSRPDWCHGRLVRVDGDIEADFGMGKQDCYRLVHNGASMLMFMSLGGAAEVRLMTRTVVTFCRAAELLDRDGDPLPVQGPRLRALEWTGLDECRGRFADGSEVALTLVRNNDEIGVRGQPDVLAGAADAVRELLESAVVLMCRTAQGEYREGD